MLLSVRDLEAQLLCEPFLAILGVQWAAWFSKPYSLSAHLICVLGSIFAQNL